MITRGIEIAAKGMQSLIDLNDVVANNLANVNTAGFKKANLTFKSIYDAAINEKENPNDIKFGEYRKIGELSMGSKTDKLLLEFSQGNIERTGSILDLAIQGDGFFKTESLNGEITYTRNGSFTTNNQGMLVTKEGDYVLDEKSKRIALRNSELNSDVIQNLVINEDGQITLSGKDNSTPLQKIGVFDFIVKTDMKSLGISKFVPKTPSKNPEVAAQKFKLQQGAVEGANSNPITEMINIINVTRTYETLSKYVKNSSDLVSKAINLGRVQ